MPDQTLELQVTLENGQFKVASKEVTAQVKKTGDAAGAAGEAGKKGFGKLTTGMKAFATAAKATVVLALVAGFVKLVKTSLQSAAAFEKQEIALTVMLKSAKKAKVLLKEITTFAATTPFQLPGLIDASKTLLAFGVAQEDIIPTMRNLGNAAQGNAEKLDQLTLAYGKVKAKGKASLEEINMFTEKQVPLMEELSRAQGVSTATMFKMISQGKIGFAEVDEALKNLTTGTGKFAGMLEKQSQSLSGLFSTLKDKLGLLALDMGQKLSPAMKDLVGAFLDGTDSGGVFTEVLSNVAWILKKIINLITVFVRGMSLLTTSIERGLIKVKKLKFEISQGVSQDHIMQNQGNKKYAEYVELVEREAELRNESQGRMNKFLTSTEELFGLTEKIKETEKKTEEIRERSRKKKAGGGGGGTGKPGKDEFAERMQRLKTYHGLELSAEEQKELRKSEIQRAEQNKAAQEYEQYLNHKLGLDSVYFAGLKTLGNTASVFMAEKNKKLFRFGQLLALSNIAINTALAVTKVMSQLGIFGPAAAGVMITAGALQSRKVAAQKPPEFAVGSMSIPATGPAIVHKDEMIFNKSTSDGIKSGDLTVSGPGGGAAGQQPMIIQVDGKTLFEVNEGHRDDAAQNMGSQGSFAIDSPY